MEKIISKFKEDDKYYRVLNVIGGNVEHINIYEKVDDRLREVIPNMFEPSFIHKLFNNDNYVPVTQEDINFFNKALSWDKKYKLQKVNEYIQKTTNVKCKVVAVEEYCGISYAVIEYLHKHYNEIVGIILNEQCEVTYTYELSPKSMEIVITELATKLDATKSKFIQYSHYVIWGIKKEKDSIVVSKFNVGSDNLICEKAFAIHIEAEGRYRLYTDEENTNNEVFKIIENEVQKMIDTFMEYILRENLDTI